MSFEDQLKEFKYLGEWINRKLNNQRRNRELVKINTFDIENNFFELFNLIEKELITDEINSYYEYDLSDSSKIDTIVQTLAHIYAQIFFARNDPYEMKEIAELWSDKIPTISGNTVYACSACSYTWKSHGTKLKCPKCKSIEIFSNESL